MVPLVSGLPGSTRTGERLGLFPTFKFVVKIDGIPEAAFVECSGLDMSNEPFEYKEGGVNNYVHKFPGRTNHSNITLKRGFLLSNEIYKWYLEMEDCLHAGKSLKFRQVTISLYTSDEQGPSMVWHLDRAFPVKWGGPTLKTDEAAVAIETLEFAHHGMIDNK